MKHECMCISLCAHAFETAKGVKGIFNIGVCCSQLAFRFRDFISCFCMNESGYLLHLKMVFILFISIVFLRLCCICVLLSVRDS